MALKRLALPVSYWRAAEFAYAWRHLAYPSGARILDLGSPKDFAAILARHRGHALTAVDILQEAVNLSRRYAVAQGIDGTGPGKVNSEAQDGRALPYADESFDAAYSISVLEHIPDRGDSRAIHELARVVKPGGCIVATVPYDSSYRETFAQGPVYERRPRGAEPIFFERHYDEAALSQRLFQPSLADVVDVEYWGEGRARIEAILDRLGPFRNPLSPFEALLSALFLRRVDATGPEHPMAAFFTLRKRAR